MKIINNVIYTLFLISKKRNLKDHYLISRSTSFFIFYVNALSLIAFSCWLCNTNFIGLFMLHKSLILVITLLGFIRTQFYAKRTIHKVRKIKNGFTKYPPLAILSYSILSVIILFCFIQLNAIF